MIYVQELRLCLTKVNNEINYNEMHFEVQLPLAVNDFTTMFQ